MWAASSRGTVIAAGGSTGSLGIISWNMTSVKKYAIEAAAALWAVSVVLAMIIVYAGSIQATVLATAYILVSCAVVSFMSVGARRRRQQGASPGAQHRPENDA
jgi:hypothetical protein